MGSPIRFSGVDVDLASRIAFTTTIASQVSAAAEVVIASLNLPSGFRSAEAVLLDAWVAFLIGASGTAARLRIRRTDINGSVVGDTDALTGGVAAGNKLAQDVAGADASSVGVYALTLQVTAGAAQSTISALRFVAFTI